jgi:hypothetical protein
MSHPWISSTITHFIDSTTSPIGPPSPRDPLIPLRGSPSPLIGPPLLRAHHFLVVHNFLEILHLVSFLTSYFVGSFFFFFLFGFRNSSSLRNNPLKIVTTKTIMEHTLLDYSSMSRDGHWNKGQHSFRKHKWSKWKIIPKIETILSVSHSHVLYWQSWSLD